MRRKSTPLVARPPLPLPRYGMGGWSHGSQPLPQERPTKPHPEAKTVGEMLEMLSMFPRDAILGEATDQEGNSFRPLGGFSAHIGDFQRQGSHYALTTRAGADSPEAARVVILWPV